MTQVELKEKIADLKAKAQNPSLPASAKAAVEKMIADLEAQLKTEAEPKKPEAKAAPKAEKKETAKPASKKPERGTEYDCDELIASAKEKKAKAKKAAAERAKQPKKTPATKNKEAVAKTTERVTTNVEKRVVKGQVTPAEVEKLISEYEAAITKLRALLKALKSGKKMAHGGSVDDADNQFSALKAGLRHSSKYASVEMRGGKVYHRRNANQFGKVKGGKTYNEGRDNRVDKKKYI